MFEPDSVGTAFGTAKGKAFCRTGRQKTHLRHSMQNTGIELFLSINTSQVALDDEQSKLTSTDLACHG